MWSTRRALNKACARGQNGGFIGWLFKAKNWLI